MTSVHRLFACITGLSALLWALTVRAEDAPAGTREALQLPLPQGFPLPYAHVQLAPRNDEEAAYLDYLRTTQVFPDEGVCTRELKRRGEGKIRRDSLRIDRGYPAVPGLGRHIRRRCHRGADRTPVCDHRGASCV